MGAGAGRGTTEPGTWLTVTPGALGNGLAHPIMRRMGLNGNRFKLSDHSIPCPRCHGYPPLRLFEGRLRPECPVCDGRGSVPRTVES